MEPCGRFLAISPYISYVVLNAVTGKAKKVTPLMYILAVYIFL